MTEVIPQGWSYVEGEWRHDDGARVVRGEDGMWLGYRPQDSKWFVLEFSASQAMLFLDQWLRAHPMEKK